MSVNGRWRAAILGGVGIFGPIFGCFVTVDESLVHRDAGAPTAVEASTIDADKPVEASSTVYRGMACGSAHCLPPRQVCCTGSDGDPDRAHGHCDTEADCPTGDFWQCMGPTDCARVNGPPVCCSADHKGGGFSRASCQAACAADAFELCEPDNPTCAAPKTCQASAGYPGLFVCQ